MKTKEKPSALRPKPPQPEIVLVETERQRCEVWTRVMGYHRPVSQFNVGKKSEHQERKHFQADHVARDLRPAQ